MVPGHEIVGLAIGVGSAVRHHRVGEHVAVGCMVDGRQRCDQSRKGEEQLCREGNSRTYNDVGRIAGERTCSGYAKHLVVREEFAPKGADGLDLARLAPLLCTGITTCSPLRTWNTGPGSRAGVAVLGGLGHMTVKLAAAMDADVTVLSRMREKAAEASLSGPSCRGSRARQQPVRWKACTNPSASH